MSLTVQPASSPVVMFLSRRECGNRCSRMGIDAARRRAHGTCYGLRELDLYVVKGCNSPYQPLAIPKSRMLTGIQVHWSCARAKLTRLCCSLDEMDVGWGADQGSIDRRSVTLACLKARIY